MIFSTLVIAVQHWESEIVQHRQSAAKTQRTTNARRDLKHSDWFTRRRRLLQWYTQVLHQSFTSAGGHSLQLVQLEVNVPRLDLEFGRCAACFRCKYWSRGIQVGLSSMNPGLVCSHLLGEMEDKKVHYMWFIDAWYWCWCWYNVIGFGTCAGENTVQVVQRYWMYDV